MKSIQYGLVALTIGLFAALSILVAGSWRTYANATSQTVPQAAPAEVQMASADGFTVDTTVAGTVELGWGAVGQYDDALTPPTAEELSALPDIGAINITLLLQKQPEGAVTGYVSIDNSLVFTAHHTISTTLAVGPAVSGTYKDGKLNLLSEQFANTTKSEQDVERQFRLTADPDQRAGLLTGEYRETVWGFGLQPLTIVGVFNLQDLDDINFAPVAVDDRAGTEQGVAVTIDVVANDNDANGDALAAAIGRQPVSGVAEAENGQIFYTPNAGFDGVDTMTYAVTDGRGGADTATVTVTVGDGIDPNADADGDGVSNSDEDLNGDGDFRNDDTDGDGSPDYADSDDDGDGIPTATEGTGDSDGDGIPDYLDDEDNSNNGGDDDGDGIPNATEGDGDSDGDGTPDYLDPDDDGDGIPTATEGTGDTDSDGTPDYLDPDDDRDGIPTLTEGTADTDNDGTPDYLDEDDDGDGIPTATEGTVDTDNDGTPDYLDPDDDGDGVPTLTEGTGDTDNDGTLDYLDEDDDGDGIPTATEGTGDSDGDGISDYLDDEDNTNSSGDSMIFLPLVSR